jgi:hypothetical protein
VGDERLSAGPDSEEKECCPEAGPSEGEMEAAGPDAGPEASEDESEREEEDDDEGKEDERLGGTEPLSKLSPESAVEATEGMVMVTVAVSMVGEEGISTDRVD